MTNISIDEVRQARDRSAAIVLEYGEQYLPLFERLDQELEQLLHKEKLLCKVQEIVTQNGTPIGTPTRGNQ